MNQFLSSFLSFVFIMVCFGVIALLVVLWNYKKHEVEDLLNLEDVAFVDHDKKCLLRFYLPKGWTYEGGAIPRHIMRKLDRRSFRFATDDEVRCAHQTDESVARYVHFFSRHKSGIVARQSIISAKNFADNNECKNKALIVLVSLAS